MKTGRSFVVFPLCVLLFLTLSFASAPVAFSQGAGSASLTGTVEDQGGLVIADASVVIKNMDTGIERTLNTNDQGLFTAPLLQPGTYEIRVTKAGFAEVIRKDIHLAVGQTLAVDFRLPIKTATESITVTGEAGVINTEKSEVSTLITQTQVENLPLNGRRWDNLVLLTPGVSEDGGFGGVSFRGISSLYNNNMVDGSDNNQAFFAEARGRTRLPYGYSLDAIKEFQVNTAAYSAEYGRAAGGVVNAITRSGGNNFHGDAFYFVRDSSFLAQDPRSKELGQPKPDERRQQFGGSFGGPLVQNKLFFFLNYDQQKRNFPAVIGPFSSSYANEIDPTKCTSPNCPAVIAAFNALTFTTNPRKGDNYLGLGKVDYQVNQNNRISTVFNILRWNSPNGIFTGPVLSTTELANGTDQVSNEFITTSWNSIITQSLVNDFRFQYGRDFESQIPNASGPAIQITGAANIGMSNFLPRGAFPNEKRFQWVDSLSWVKGRHVWKFGADINYVRDDIQNLFQGGGVYSYFDSGSNVALQKLADDLANGTRQWASFTQAVDPITGSGKGFFTTNDINFYAQDNIKVRPNFTLNLGLRYELQTMPGIVQANPNVPETASLNTDTNNFGPRVGFSYGIGSDQKTVVRGGYGLYYGRTQNSSLFVSLFQNGVFQQTFRFTTPSSTNTSICAGPTAPNLMFPQPSTAPAFTPIFGPQGGPTPTNNFNSLQDFLTACPAAAASSSVVDALSPDFVNPLVHEYDLAVERELPGKLSLSVSFLGARGLRLPVFVDANLAPPDTTRTYVILDSNNQPTGQFTVPFFSTGAARLNPNVGVLLEGKSVVNSWYNGLVVDVKRRISHGFSFDANFTWAQARDTGQVAGVNGTFAGTVRALNPYDIRGEAGLSEIDIRRRLIINTYWELPFAKWTDNDTLKHIVGGWRASTIWRIQDGRPVEADLTGRPSCGPSSNARDGGLTCGAVDGNGNPANGRIPFIARNSGFTSPGFFDADMRIGREFKPTERTRLEFLWEAFNLFNRYNPVSVDSGAYSFSASSTSATSICNPNTVAVGISDFNGCVKPLPSFLRVTATGNTLYNARQMQLGVKFSF
jgi:hypothetical protein